MNGYLRDLDGEMVRIGGAAEPLGVPPISLRAEERQAVRSRGRTPATELNGVFDRANAAVDYGSGARFEITEAGRAALFEDENEDAPPTGSSTGRSPIARVASHEERIATRERYAAVATAGNNSLRIGDAP